MTTFIAALTITLAVFFGYALLHGLGRAAAKPWPQPPARPTTDDDQADYRHAADDRERAAIRALDEEWSE